jgi:hypothetical protein
MVGFLVHPHPIPGRELPKRKRLSPMNVVVAKKSLRDRECYSSITVCELNS